MKPYGIGYTIRYLNSLKPKISAIVSTYNSERFMRGCLDDLLSQTVHKQGRLEIIVVNAGSKQSEDRIVREYIDQGAPIVYIHSLREPLYVSWNRAVRIATGDYLTSANTDDRHRPDALEIMADELDSNPGISLVYSDAYVTTTENAVWGGDYEISYESPYTTGRLAWPDFERSELLRHCYIGQAPMWRRSVHDTVGGFDESYLLAGDYEFWMRMAATGHQMKHIPETLGIFYRGGMGIANQQQSAMESRRAVLQWRGALQNG